MHDESVPTRRTTRRSYAEAEAEHFTRELGEGGAYVSPGRLPWRGLSGHDPYDDLPDDERGERAWEDWHDAGLDPEDRPQRRRPSGRDVDMVPPVVGEVVVRVDPEIAARFAARQAEATPGAAWDVDNAARVTIVGDFKVWRGTCAQCATEFEQRRPRSQRRRWAKVCGDECRVQWERGRARDRMRRLRGADAA